MTKITVIGTKRHLRRVISELYELHVLHIEEHVKDDLMDIGTPLPDSSVLSELIIKLNAAIALFRLRTKAVTVDFDVPLDALIDNIDRKLEEVTSLDRQQVDIRSRITSIDESLEKLRILAKAGIDPGDFSDLSSVKLLVGFAKDRKVLDELRHISSASYDLQPYAGKHLLSVVVSKDETEKVSTLLARHGISLLAFDGLDPELSTSQNQEKMTRELKRQKEELSAVIRRLDTFRESYADFFLQARERILIANEQAEAPLKFGATEKTFVVTGFVPSDNLLRVHRRLSKVTDDTILIYLNSIGEKESVPIEMDNPTIVRPFEFFMKLYTLPNYHEIDPTFFTFLTFPFFFGFMLGDMGYGLVNLVLFLWLKKKIPSAKAFFNIMVWASIMTILAGAAFGEFFGFEQLGRFHIPHLLGRSEQQMDLLVLSIIIGAAHIILGLFIGFANELRHHGLKHAIFSKISWLVLLSGAAMFVFHQNLYGYLLLGLAVVMLLIGEGAMGLIELPSIFGNILSYSRLMAIGLASVSLAVIIDKFAVEFTRQGGLLMILAAVLIMVVGHVINMLLGLIGPFLHSLRLHYVEFFSKFYTGGGKLYRPFGYAQAEQQE
ncbi:MAG: V-type ATP synthase subunit I [DPANN group archaeon]|nr:V-type ATP synthase subunit I [DPANN group archaeon]